MKKVIIICSAIALIFQSCSSEKMFSHKRYGHLNWIDHNTKVETKGNGLEPVSEQKVLKKEISPIINKKEETAVIKNETTIQSEEIIVENSQNPVNSTHEFTLQKNNSDESDEIETKKIVEQINQNKIEQTIDKVKDVTSPKVDGDVLLIICVILCFIIPPLAMYVWDKNTDMWFILDLILFLLIAFYFIGYGWGLAGLAAVLIALLRVFQII